MLIGYNNDVTYREKVFHIQTEDRGEGALQIETQIFHSGAILDTRIVSYAELFEKHAGDKKEREKSIKTLMQTTHRELYKKLFSGDYDEMAGLVPAPGRGARQTTELDAFTPSQDRIPDAARELEEAGSDAFAIKGEGDHVDLASLKSKLAKMGASDAGGGGESLDESADVAQGGGRSTAPRTSKPLFSFSKKRDAGADPSEIRFAKGVKAWGGCEVDEDALAITELVEAALSA